MVLDVWIVVNLEKEKGMEVERRHEGNFWSTCNIFQRFYLFLFRERGTEGKKERNINVWLPLKCPLMGTWPTT